MRKIVNILVSLFLTLLIEGTAVAQQSPAPLTSFDFTIVGIGLNASPDYQAVPKGINSQVLTNYFAPGITLPQAVIDQMPKDYQVKGELSGPAYSSPMNLTTQPGKPFNLPTLPILGKYTLGNIRLFDNTGKLLFGATPQAVTIESISDPLVTSVTTHQLTLQEIQQQGIVIDSSNYTAYQFTTAIATSSGQVPITLPVVIPSSQTVVNPEDIPPPSEIGVVPPAVQTLPPNVPETAVPQNLTISPFVMEVDDPDPVVQNQIPPIPGIVVIPGNIGFLNQFFSALVLVTNGAPGQSNLIIKDISAKINLPAGEDLIPGTDAVPGDDPIRMAKVASGYLPRTMTIFNAGPDAQYGTADDVSLMHPAESGQADFTIEGRKEGTHKLVFDITATLEGLPIGPVTIRGKATGAVLVRNPDFTLTFGHPKTIRSGEEYDLFITITNTSKVIANLVSVHLDPHALSGAKFVTGETSDKNVDTILPGSSATVRYRLQAQRTGAVTATAFESEDVKGRFNLRTGVGENGIPLSPDSLILPYTGSLTQDLIDAAVGLLGQAWSVATAPSGALPSSVLPIGKQTVVDRANDLSEAGLRVLIGEKLVKAAENLSFDLIGSDSANRGFDSLRRTSTQGLNVNAALASIFQQEIATAGAFPFQADFAEQETYRPAHISVITTEAPIRVQVSDATGNRIGTLADGTGYREIPYADQLRWSSECAVQSPECTAADWSTLSLITKIDSAGYRINIDALSNAAFDLGIVAPGASGVLRQIRFSGVSIPQGGKAWLLILPGENIQYVLNIDNDNDGSVEQTIASSILAIPDPGPRIVAATQLVPGFGPGGDKHGRNVAVLFSERVTKETASNIANYSVEANGVKAATVQPSNRMVFLLLRDGIGPFFGSVDPATGNFLGRAITVSGLKDPAGNDMTGATTMPIHITAQGPAAVVDGVVRKANGEPVANAKIKLMQLIWWRDPLTGIDEPKYAIFTEKNADASGAYHLDYVLKNDDPAGPFMIEATNPVNNDVGQVTTNVLSHGQRMTIDIFMKARGSVSGTVRNEQGAAVAGTSVQITTLNDGRMFTSSSDASGAYSFTNLSVGAFNIKAVSQALYAQGTVMGTLPDDGSAVVQDVTIYKLDSVAKGNIAGKVFAADGTTPKTGMVVIVEVQPNYKNWVRTGSDGSFSFTGVYAGSAKILVRDDVTGERSTVNGIVTNGNTSVFTIVMKGTGTISGRITREDGKSSEGLYVVATPTDSSDLHWVIQSDANGLFSFPSLPVGDIKIDVLDPKDFNRTVATVTITLLTQGDIQNALIVVADSALAVGTIEGVVHRRDGSAWANADIWLLLNDYQYIAYKADATGKFSMPNLALRTYRVTAMSGSTVINGSATLWYGSQVVTLDLYPAPLGTVAGTTYDDAEKTIPTGADVILYSSKPNQVHWLNYDTNFPTVLKSDPVTGRYTFNGVFAGAVTVKSSNIFRPVPAVGTGSITSEGQTVTLDLALKGSPTPTTGGGTTPPVNTMGSASGIVYQPDGKTPVGNGVKVKVTYGGADVVVTTHDDGTFQFGQVIPAGNYCLIAQDDVTTLKGRSCVNVPTGVNVTTAIRLLGRGNLTVRTLTAGGSIAQDISVAINGTAFPQDSASGRTEANGEITFFNLSEGSYSIAAKDTYHGLGGGTQSTIPNDGAAITAEVRLAAVGSITGTFLKADNTTPIKGGQIKLIRSGQVIAYTTTSSNDADAGKFLLEYVTLGDFTLEGYDPVTERTGKGGGRLATNGDVVFANVVVTPRGTVGGVVLNYGGTAPIANASVNISVIGAAGYNYTTNTGPDGEFLFAGVPAGKYNLDARDPSNGLHGTASGTLTYEGEAVQANIHIAPTGSIEGRVLMPDGVTPVLDAFVSFTDNTGRMQVDPSTGGFRYANLAAGTGYTYAMKAAQPNTHRVGKTSVKINTDGDVAMAAITLRGVGTVQGKVFDGDGQTPLPGMIVTITAVGTDNQTNNTDTRYTTTDGSFLFTDVPVGTFTLVGRNPDPKWPTAASASGTIANEGDAPILNLVFAPVSHVTGTVLKADGITPAAGGGVKYTGCGRTYLTVIDSSGVFLISNIPVPCASFTLYMEDAQGVGIGYASGSLTMDDNGETKSVGIIVLDDKAIAVTSITPVDGTQNVPETTNIRINFSEPADPATLVSANIYVMRTGNVPVPGALTLDPDNRAVTFTPSQTLAGMTQYTVYVTTGVKDRVKRPLPQNVTSSFTTRDNMPPSVSGVSPLNGAAEVAQDGVVRVTFTEPVAADHIAGIRLMLNGGTIDARIDLVQGNTVAILTPLNLLSLNAVYVVTVNNVQDIAGNVMTGSFISSFATLDTVAPVVSLLSVPSNADLIKGNTVPVTAMADADTALMDYFVDGVLSFTSRTAPFVYNLTLAKEGVIVVKAIAQDRVGNRNPSIPWAKELTLTATADTPPTVTITSPTDNSQFSTNAAVSVSVSALDDLFAKEITLTAAMNGQSLLNQTKTNGSGKAFTASFSFTVPLNAAPGNQIQIVATAKDSGGQASAMFQRTITVKDGTAPVVTSLTSPGTAVKYKPGDTGAALVTATDNIGVVSVTCTASGAASGSQIFTIDPALSTTQTFSFIVSATAAPYQSMSVTCSAKDNANNTSPNSTISMQTADIVPPAIAMTSIPNNGSNVQARPSITVTFNETVLTSTVNGNSVYLMAETGSGQAVPGAVSLSSDRKTITFVPSQDLIKATVYALTISTAVADDAGNKLAADYSLRFTTDNTPPAVAAITPADGAQNVALGIAVVVRFTEAINPATLSIDRLVVTSPTGTVTGTLSISANNTMATFAPTSPMTFSTDYTVALKPGIEDVMGNATTTDIITAFKTGSYGEQLKVVYYDTRYPVAWISRAAAQIYKNFLVANGFTVMNADELKTFMQANGVGSLVVMAQDVAPDTVADVNSSNAVIRKYLDAGGTVVWMQEVPFYTVGSSNGTSVTWSWSAGQNILGISWASQACGVVDVLHNGALLGFGQTWTSCRPVASTQVTKVFASNANGANAWIKNFNAAYPDTGFIRIWDNSGSFTTNAYLEDLITILGLNKGDVKYPDVVARYHMDNDWNDASGNGYNGTPNNYAVNTQFSSTAKVGAASGNFDGVNDYVKVNSSALIANSVESTIEAWVYPTSFASTSKTIYAENISGGVVFVLGVGTDGKPYFGIWRSDITGNWIYASSTVSLSVNSGWYHIAGTLGQKGMKIYVNGVLTGSQVNVLPSNGSITEVSVGRINNSGGSSYFSGLIDELTVFNRSLPLEDILEHYNSGISDDRMPPLPPVVDPVASPTYSSIITLSGTKDADASIRVNGRQIVSIDGSTSWSATYRLQLGENRLHVTSRDAAGNESPEVLVTIELAPAKGEDPDIVGLWHFDGTWKDFSGNSNHGYAYNGATFSSEEKIGAHAASFDGADDYAQMMMDVPERNFSVDFWARTAIGGGVLSVNAGSFSGSGGHDRHFYVSDAGNACFRVYNSGAWCSSAKINDNAWHHWMFVVETGIGQKFYLDGVLVGTNPYDHSDFTTQDRLTLGYSADKGYFKGLIDELRILKRSLQAEEVRTRFNAGESIGLPPNPPVISPAPPATTYYDVVVLSGSKDADTAVWANNKEVYTRDGSTTWQAAIALDQGVNSLSVYARNAAGLLSAPITVAIEVLQGKVTDTDLVALWHFDGTWSDYSGNNNHLVPYSPNISGPVFSTDAKVGSASAYFDGANDYAEAASSSSLNVGAQSWTVAAWVKTLFKGTAWIPIVTRYECGWNNCSPADGSASSLYQLFIDESGFASFQVRSENGILSRVADDRDVRDGNWHHVAGMLDRSNKILRLYVDGEERNIVSAENISTINDAGSPVVIGSLKNSAQYGSFFSGQIDETAIYKRALLPEEVRELVMAGSSTNRNKPSRPTVNDITSPTTNSTLSLSGTKDAGTSIRVNNIQLVAADTDTEWRANYSLPQVGSNVMSVTSRDAAGKQSDAVVVAVTLIAANQVNADIVGLWHLDGSGNDYSGNNNHLSLKNMAAFNIDAIVGGGSIGLNGLDEYLEKTSPSVLNIGNQNWTVSAWIKTGAQNTDAMIILERYECGWNNCSTTAAGSDGNVNAWFKLFIDTNGRASFYVRSDDGNNVTVADTQDLRDVSWHHVVGELDRTAGRLRIFVDGVEKNSVPAAIIGTMNDAGSPLEIGRHVYGNQTGHTPQYFKGLIDEVTLLKRALAGADVLSAYTNGKNERVRPAAPLLNSIESPTSRHIITLSGIKEPNTSIYVNGLELVPLDSSIAWQSEYILQTGSTTLRVTAKNAIGSESDPTTAIIDVLTAAQSDPDIAALWHFDGNWSDYSGNGNHLTPMNNALFTADARVGSGAGLFATSLYASRATGTAMPLGSSPRTFAAWIKPYSYPDATYNGIIALGQMVCNQGSVLSIKNDGRISMSFWCNDTNQTIGPSVALNQWNHVAFTYSSGNKVKFYLNGKMIQESTLSIGSSAGSVPNTVNGPVRIGSTDNPGRMFNGLIDEAVIYRRALGDLEMEKLYNQGAGRVGVWHMDGAWDDSSGNNNGGMPNNGATFQAIGRAGTPAGSFGGIDDSVLGYAPVLPMGNAPRTVSAWVKAGTGSQDRAVFEYGTGSGATSAGDFHIYVDSANITAAGTGFGSNVIHGTSRLNDGKWHHVVAVYEGTSTNIARIYVDGISENSGVIAAPGTSGGNYSFGAFLSGSGNFNGLLDEVVVYNYALSPYEIEKHFNEELGRVGYWPMDNTWEDKSRNGNDGTAANGATFSTDAKFGTRAASFDGVDDYVTFGTDADMLFTGPHTLESWVKFSGFPAQWAPLGIVQPYRYGLWYDSVSKKLAARRDAGSTLFALDTSMTLTANTWYHFVQTFDGTDLAIYVNGLLLNKGQEITSANNNTLNPAIMGRGWTTSDTGKLQGLLDEVSVYTRAFEADEVRRNFNDAVSLGVTPGAPTINSAPTTTSASSIILSGSKESGTSIWINGLQAVSLDNNTTWSTTYPLHPGANVISVAARSSSGSLSEPVPIVINVPPVVISSTMQNNTTIAPVDAPISVLFSEPLATSSVNAATVVLSVDDGTNQVVAGTVTLTVDRKTITFTPAAQLVKGVRYRFTITAAVMDDAGNTLAEAFILRFTTSLGLTAIQNQGTASSPYSLATGQYTDLVLINSIAIVSGPISAATVSLTNSTLITKGTITTTALILSTNSILTHAGATLTDIFSVDVNATSVDIDSTSKIDVTGKGYLGGYSGGNNSNYGRTIGNTTTGGSYYYSGASYGGLGGMYGTYAVNAVYGDLMNPNELGSGGGGYSAGYAGGNGGGLVRIKAGSITLDGSIVADGGTGSTATNVGAGSGGGILVNTSTLTGTGTVSAKGGPSTYGAGGGGGRIAIYYGMLSLPTTSIIVSGGTGNGGGSRNGSVGTIYYQELPNVAVDAPPTVSLSSLSQSNGVVSGVTFTVIVNAVDDLSLSQLTLTATGETAFSETRSRIIVPSYSAIFTLTVPSGAITGNSIELTATARDSAGNVGQAVLSIPVKVITPPTVNPVSTTTNNIIVLSGTKEPQTSIRLNDIEVLARDGNSTWQVIYSIAQPGDTVLTIRSADALGYLSQAVTTTVTLLPASQFDQDLVGLWHMDGSWNDFSGNGNHGTASNGAVFSSDRMAGTASASFNGSNGYLEIKNSSVLNPPLLTVEAWAKSNTATWNNYGFLVSKRNAYILSPMIGSKEIVFYIWSNGGWRSVASNDPNLTITSWHHYAATFDGAMLRLYVDGELKGSSPYAGAIDITDAGSLFIGWDDGISGRYFNGFVDEVSIFKRALTAAEIRRSFGMQHGGSIPSAPTIDSVSTTTTENTIALSGTKDAGTSIYINETLVSPLDNLTTWSFSYALHPGTNTISVVSRNAIGNWSEPVSVTIVVPPVVVSSSPLNNAIGVPQDTTISALFSEPLATTSVNASSVFLSFDNGMSQPISGMISLSADRKTVVFTPSAQLAKEGKYIFTITTAVTDDTGNAIIADFLLRFSTTAGLIQIQNQGSANAPYVLAAGDYHDLLITNSTVITAGTISAVTVSISGSTLISNETISVQLLALTSNSVLTHGFATDSKTNSLMLIASTLTVDSSSKIDVSGRGYLGGWQGANNSSTGRTVGNTTDGGSVVYNGGSYGGMGGRYYGAVGNIYGDSCLPNDVGSGGGGENSAYYGGNGGGLVRIKAGVLSLSGSILAEGMTVNLGGGSGGGMLLNIGTLTGAGTISADGGASLWGVGAGGGGRIAIYYVNKNGYTGTVKASGGAGDIYEGIDGAVGTVYYEALPETGADRSPEISITSPVLGKATVADGTLAVSIQATDDLGLKEVTITATGETAFTETRTNLIAPKYNATFTIHVPSDAITGNTITLTAIARDWDGNTSQDVRIVLIKSVVPPTVNPVSSPTSTNIIMLSGTKEPETYIDVNNVQIAGVDSTTAWQAAYSLTQPGDNILAITSRDADGNRSKPVTIAITLAPANLSDPDLVGLWHMDGSWNDYSGNGNHGTASGGAAFSSDRMIGLYSGLFDGSDDMVTSTTGYIPGVSNTFTIEFWAYPSATRGITAESSYGVSGVGGQRYAIIPGWIAYPNAGVGISVGTNGVSVFEHSGDYLPSLLVYNASLSGWYHIVLVYENRLPKLYVNGQLVRTGVASQRTNVYPSSSFGGIVGYGMYQGLIDEVAMYRRALTAEEINRKFTENAGTPPGAPVLNQVPSRTVDSTIVLSGTKEAGSSIWINGAMAVGVDDSISWQANFILQLGTNLISVANRNSAGDSDPVSVTIIRLPVLVSSSIANNSIDVSTLAGISVQFNGQLGATSITSETIYLAKDSTNERVAGSLAVSSDLKTITFTPASSLSGGTVYRFVVTGSVTDLWGNALAADSVIRFTTIPDLIIQNEGTAATPSIIASSEYSQNIVIINSNLIIEENITANSISLINSIVTAKGRITTNSLTLSNNSALMPDFAFYSSRLEIIVNQDIAIDATSSINASGRGCMGGYQGSNATPSGMTLYAQIEETESGVISTVVSTTGSAQYNGGSYGGNGGIYDGIAGTANRAYGSLFSADLPGSGGGAYDSANGGGNGGGLVIINAGRIHLYGSILADGQSAITNSGITAGAGSGGSISINAGSLSGEGKISARGGDSSWGGAGSGGRIAIVSGDMTLSRDTIDASGGGSLNAHAVVMNGGAGTIYLYVCNLNSCPDYGDVIIDNKGTETTADSTPLLPAVGRGMVTGLTSYSLTDDAAQWWPGSLNNLYLFIEGFSRLPQITNNNNATLYTNSESLRSYFTVGNYYSGMIRFNSVHINGRAKVGIADHLQISGDLVIEGGSLTVDDVTANNIIMINGGVLSHFGATTVSESRLLLNVVSAISIDSTSSIDVSGKGYLGGSSGGNEGTYGMTLGNATESGSARNNGGSYGGLGGLYSGASSSVNAVYGDLMYPDELGSGGGASDDGVISGGNGGGFVEIYANRLILYGSIVADGENKMNQDGSPAGGGSGGGVYIETTTLEGTGRISANGGKSAYGGAGGGGRIAVYYNTMMLPALNLNVAGGVSGDGGITSRSGSAGSVYTQAQ